MSYSQRKDNVSAVHTLKGLLMDKGAQGIHANIRTVLQRMLVVRNAMEDLMAKQRANREAVGSECIELYLAIQMRTKDEALQEVLDKLPADVLPKDAKGNHYAGKHMMLEWRARQAFSREYGYGLSARVQAFRPGHKDRLKVFECISQNTPDFYSILAGYDVLRVTLNVAMKSLRKTLVDLSEVIQATHYPEDVQRDAKKFSHRLFTTLPQHQDLSQILEMLYSDYDSIVER